MSETVKLIVELPKDYYEIIKCEVEQNLTDYYPFIVIGNGIPLDDIKSKISEISKKYPMTVDYESGLNEALDIIDNIGKGGQQMQ